MISASQFQSAFGKARSEYLSQFLSKFGRELEKVVHPASEVGDFALVRGISDSAGNIRTGVRASVTFVNETGEIRGEFVWLRNVKKFRGKLWSSIPYYTDLQLVVRARDSFRCGQFAEAKSFLDAIQRFEDVPESAKLLNKLLIRELG